MLKKLTHAVLMLAGILFASVPLSYAALGNSVSSTTVPMPNSTIPFVFVVNKNEAVQYILTSTAPLNPGCTVNFEMSTNMSNWSIVQATATATGGFNNAGGGINVTLAPNNVQTFYRFNILSTGAVPIPLTVTIRDVDDVVGVTVKNNKAQDVMQQNDDSFAVFGAIKADRVNMVPVSSGVVTISSSSQIGWGLPVPADKAYPFSVLFPTYVAQVQQTYVVIQTTGSAALAAGAGERGVVLSAVPTISTDTAVNGDIIEFHCLTSSITFTDFTGLSVNGRSSALKLGAATRACGTGDTLSFVYLNGFWRERYFLNVISE